MDQSHAVAAVIGVVPGFLVAVGFFLKSRGRKGVIEAQTDRYEAKTEHITVEALVRSLTNSRTDLEAAQRAWNAATRERDDCDERLAAERKAREEEDARCRRNLAAMAIEVDNLRASMGQPRTMVAMLARDVREVVADGIIESSEEPVR